MSKDLIEGISKYSDQIGGFAGKYSSYNKFFKTDFATSCDGVGTKYYWHKLQNHIFPDHYNQLESIA